MENEEINDVVGLNADTVIMEEELENADKQSKNSRIAPLLPYQWKKGQSGNIMGRPKGKTMKEYAKDFLSKMTDEERDEWLEGMEKHKIWEMSEGKPETKTDITTAGESLNTALVKFLDGK